MDAQKKRQVILIIGVVLAVLYGLYSVVIDKKTKDTGMNPQMQAKELKSFIEQTNMEITRHMPMSFDAYVINRARDDWGESLFLWKKGNTKKTGSDADLFIYTGFVDFGDRKAAIINDVQYKTGEALEKEGFIVRRILPDSVVIKNTLENTEFTIPLFE